MGQIAARMRPMFSRVFFALLTLLVAAGAPSVASAQRFTLIGENDALGNGKDRDYTQGLRFSVTFDDFTKHPTAGRVYDVVGMGVFTPFSIAGPVKKQLEWIPIGQSIFTPDRISSTLPRIPGVDRPFAGWLYTGVSAMQETGGRQLDTFEILAGVVGPAALGKETQDAFHQLLGQGRPFVGNFRLKNEPGIVLSWDRKWKFGSDLGNSYGIDFIPSVGFSGGNVYTYGSVGGMVRFGRSLSSTWGPTRIRPSPSGGTFFTPDPTGPWLGWNIFGGVEARAVALNVFLDGNNFTNSLSVSRKTFVADFIGGIELYTQTGHRLAFSVTHRTKEYDTQPAATTFGAVEASYRF